jgi:hypothetical protein
MNNPYRLTTFLFLLLAALPASAQSWGVGVRLGDPTGLTLKKYARGKALEINFGRTGFRYKDDWYDKRFHKWFDRRGYVYQDVDYNGYRGGAPLSIQLHFLRQKGIDKRAVSGLSGLEWYYGVGAQVQFDNYRYDYRYKVNGNWVYVEDERVFGFDLGVDVPIGLEYTFRETPITLFIDLSLYMELVDDPFFLWLQGGLGARYRF